MKKAIYLGDIHSSDYFLDFTKKIKTKFKNDDLKFIFTGDLFDRGNSTIDVFNFVKNNYNKGKLEFVLGNHDLFLVLGYLSNKFDTFLVRHGIEDYLSITKKRNKLFQLLEKKDSIEVEEIRKICDTFYDQLNFNGGDKTINQFLLNSNVEEFYQYIGEVVDFLFFKGNLYNIDELNNLIIHGGIPITNDGILLGEVIDGKFVNGFDLIKVFNDKFKELDLKTLKKLTGIDDYDIFKNKVEGDTSMHYKKDIIIGEYSSSYTITWYNNSIYNNLNKKPIKSLKKELLKNGFNRLFCGHWHNKDGIEFVKKNSIYTKTCIRLDRSHMRIIDSNEEMLNKFIGYYGGLVERKSSFGNFGYCVLDENGKIIEIGDSKDLKIKKEIKIKNNLK